MTGRAGEAGAIRVGIGGWTYAPWHGRFYPAGTKKKDELAYAATKLRTLEINGTFYRSQTPETFAKWRDAVPDGFVFAVKAPRYATNRKDFSAAAESISRFCTGGLAELGATLGPVLWQFPDHKRFEAPDFEAFLAALPALDGVQRLRHAVELRHASFETAEAVALARAHNVAIVWALDSPYPQIADVTADFAYVRLMGTCEDADGYEAATLDSHAERLSALARGDAPNGPCFGETPPREPRDVFCYVIGGHKVANPDAAMAIAQRVNT